MKSNAAINALAVLLAVSSCSGHINGAPFALQEVSPQMQVYCGRILAITLARMCPDGPQEKRGDFGTTHGAILSPLYKNQDTLSYGWPWITPHRARSLESGSRGKRQVVSECCDKPCSVDELMSYC